MRIEWIRCHCLLFPHATEQVQWGNNLVFKVSGKMFAVTSLEPRGVYLSFKCAPEEFAELIELPGIIPAPYLARAQWIALESEDTLRPPIIKRLLRNSYDLVFAKLTKKAKAELERRKRQ
jgi:predicted DNA-binding protein (MmcQ/YjbR family)